MKTRKAIGNLAEEPLEVILGRLIGNPVYEAISMGHPERMGIQYGWSVEEFLEIDRPDPLRPRVPEPLYRVRPIS